MSMRTWQYGGAVLLLAAGMCFAQQPQPAGDQPKEQKPRGREMQKQRGARPDNLLQRLTVELKLDEAQQAEVRKIMDAQRDREKELRTSVNVPQELVDRTMKTREELAQARKAGDNAKAKQLSDELVELRKERDTYMKPVQEKLEQSQEQFHDQLIVVLRDDQKAAFEEIWDEHMAASGAYGGPLRNPRMLKSQVDKLQDLTPEQKQQLDSLFENYRKAGRDKQQSDLKTRKEQTKKLYDDVIALLTPEQKEKVEAAMQGGDRHGQPARPDRPGHPGHPGQPGHPGEPGQPPQPGTEGQPPAQGGEQPTE
jgi:Spy/CpxP family protein refolding chaperone